RPGPAARPRPRPRRRPDVLRRAADGKAAGSRLAPAAPGRAGPEGESRGGHRPRRPGAGGGLPGSPTGLNPPIATSGALVGCGKQTSEPLVATEPPPEQGLTMFTRREFLQSSTLVALAPTVPAFLAQTARAAAPARDGRLLVVVQLNGGNDGINTVVPFADAGYAKCRTALRLPAARLHKVTREVGLHPAMADAAKLLEGGRLA